MPYVHVRIFPVWGRDAALGPPIIYWFAKGRRSELGHHGTIHHHTFLGLLAKIKCSICSFQFNI